MLIIFDEITKRLKWTTYCIYSFTMKTFSANSKPVWEPQKPLDNTPLFSLLEKDLSFDDAAAINSLYQCGGK